MSLLEQLMTLPARESKVRVKKEVAPWVKITENVNNPLKPKVKLSQTSLELIKSNNDYILFREIEGSLYIVSPSPFSPNGNPNKNYDTRIGVSGRLEITKAVINTWGVDLSKFHGEYELEFVGQEELAIKEGQNIIFKTFKFIPLNGNSNQSTTEPTQSIEDGLPHNDSRVDGSESRVSDDFISTKGEEQSDLVLSEDSIF